MDKEISPLRRRETQRGALRHGFNISLRYLSAPLRRGGELLSHFTQAGFILLTFALSVTLSSCTYESPTDQLKAALRTERSWAATLRLMAESWQRGDVTDAYMRKALEAVSEELQKEADSLSKRHGIAEDERAGLAERAGSLKQLATEMRRAVSQRDHAAVGGQLERLKGEEDALRRSFAESVGEPVP
jgi:hypothetical protein